MTKYNLLTGIVVKKIKYRDYHEIIQVLTENGTIESFFYENVYKNKKKLKVNIPYIVSMNFFPTRGMNKITNLEIDNSFSNIVYDVFKYSYCLNIVEYVTSLEYHEKNVYLLLKLCLDKIERGYSEKLITIYFLIQLLKGEGFVFKYQKTKNNYAAYSFLKNSFVDAINEDETSFPVDNDMVKLIYYLTIKSIDFLDGIEFSEEKLLSLFSFLTLLFKEYVGIETKSYEKIIELENMLRKNNN